MRDGNVCMMSRDGRRFSYVDIPVGPGRLNGLEIDPASLGAAPDLTQPGATPAFVVYNQGTSTTLSVRATFPGTPNGVATKAFEDGGVDTALYSYNFGGDVNDSGVNGDVTAGDGLYTVSGFQCYYLDATAPGPKTLRFAAQSRDGSNLRHSTIIDYVPFSVLTSAPSGSAPAVTGLTPSSGPAGSRVTANGSGFDPSRTGNLVTLNGHSVEVVSVNVAGTQLVFDIPPWFAPGAYDVVVTAHGQSSPPVVFTLGSTPQPPNIAVSPASLVFGNVQLGGSADLLLTVTNTGTGVLNVSAIASNNARFAIVGVPPPFAIPAGQSQQVAVRFTPAAAVAETGTLTITSNDPDEAALPIALSGTGTVAPAPSVTTQPATGVAGICATLNGVVNANGTSATVSFQYGLTAAYGSAVAAVPANVSGSANTGVSALVTGLTPNTIYHFRVSAAIAGGTTSGSDLAFTTSAASGAAQVINFDNFPAGVKPANFLAGYGIPSVTFSGTGPGVGGPRVMDHTTTNSTIPSPPNVLEQYSTSNDPNATHALTFTFAPVLASFSLDRVGKHSTGSTDTWRAYFYNAAGTLLGSFGEPVPIINAPVQTFTFTAPAGQSIARMDLVSVWTGFATHRNIPVDNFVLQPALTPLAIWRQTWFGTTADSGDAADTADPDHDGIPNLIEFATGGNPTAPGTMPGQSVLIGGNIEFTYTRSKLALADGVSFLVEWKNNLAPGTWSSAGVAETLLSSDAVTQSVKALVPTGGATQRFVRLKVSR